jgi:DNA polymerase-3 subunit gamma/tau
MSDADTAGRLAKASPTQPGLGEPRSTGPGLDDLAVAQPPLGAAPAAGYRVLARKYRPANFDDLIGQDAMVRTLSNAFEVGRIPQAWILTGVRGVGKTTTARILARGLNYALADGSVTAPTVRMPQLGIHCAAIMESRHVDVLEMDAASHNGVDDIRQINDAVRYAPVSARYKVYILDEVHMLSNQAFNALLKTLEEPPPHAKFIFATTEIRQVPITVLSRCQRFDLRRVDADRLVRHLESILAAEGVVAEPEALAMIARAAEGSVRDALSLLDQAISHAAGAVRAEDVRQMLGLADRGRIVDLFAALMRGDIKGALGELRDQYNSGADPLVALTELAEFTHFVTRVKVVPAVAEDRSLAEIERKRAREFAAALSMPVLSRTWQMLFKGLAEVKDAARPIAAAEMVLVRIAYSADLPSPEDVVRALEAAPHPATQTAQSPPGASFATTVSPSAAAPAASLSGGAASVSRPEPVRAARPALVATAGHEVPVPAAAHEAAVPTGTRVSHEPAGRAAQAPATAAVSAALTVVRFSDLIALAGERRDLQLKATLERDVRLVHFEEGKLEIALEPGASPTLIGDLSRRLSVLTGRRWMVVVSAAAAAAPTVKAQIAARQEEFKRGVQADPLVQNVLARFPGAEIVAVRQPEADFAAGAISPVAEETEPFPPPDPPVADDGDPGYQDLDYGGEEL